MLTLKNSMLLILTVSNSIAFANTQRPIGKSPSVWSVSASALYVQPSFGGNGLGYSSFSNYGYDFAGNIIEVDGAPNHLSNVNPKHKWGFAVEGSYVFCDTNDVDVNWYHLENNTHGHLPEGTLFAGSASALYAGALNVSPRWDAVNIEFGQLINFSELHNLRLHAGVEFAQVKTTFKNYPQLTTTGNPQFVTTDNIKYSGFGPRFGADYNYTLGSGLGVYAKGASSLLVGRAKQNVSGYYDLSGFNLYSTGNYTQSNSSVVVTELEAKLGLKYNHTIGNGSLGIDLGYMWVTYLNALVSQVGSGVVSSSISNSSAANFDLNGVYCGFTWTAFN